MRKDQCGYIYTYLKVDGKWLFKREPFCRNLLKRMFPDYLLEIKTGKILKITYNHGKNLATIQKFLDLFGCLIDYNFDVQKKCVWIYPKADFKARQDYNYLVSHQINEHSDSHSNFNVWGKIV